MDFPLNLRLLCSYGKSISAVCRSAGINRHQMKRYLAGDASPSLNTLRRISDFFGLEEHEILFDHKTFAALVRVRPPRLQKTRDPIAEFTGSLAERSQPTDARRYAGYYHVYFQPDRQAAVIHRALTRINLENHCLLVKTIERYPSGSAGLPRVVKYEGVAFLNGHALTVMERRPSAPEAAFYTLLGGSGDGELTFLTGLSLGTAPDLSRSIYALRTCWQYLGTEPNIRKCLDLCGQYPLDHPKVSSYARFCTTNELAPGEESFSPRS